jgi:hypothetical protein
MKPPRILFFADITVALCQHPQSCSATWPDSHRNLAKNQGRHWHWRQAKTPTSSKGWDTRNAFPPPPLSLSTWFCCPSFSLETIASQMDFGTTEEITVECEYPVLTIKHNDGKSWQEHSFHANSELIFQIKSPNFTNYLVSLLWASYGEENNLRTLELLAGIHNYKRFANSWREDHCSSL